MAFFFAVGDGLAIPDDVWLCTHADSYTERPFIAGTTPLVVSAGSGVNFRTTLNRLAAQNPAEQ